MVISLPKAVYCYRQLLLRAVVASRYLPVVGHRPSESTKTLLPGLKPSFVFVVWPLKTDDVLCVSADGLFGRCESGSRLGAADLWRPTLDTTGAKLLESELERLWAQGYRWRHVYSQCVVRSALSAIQHGRLYDPGFCARTLRSTLPIVHGARRSARTDVVPYTTPAASPVSSRLRFTPNSALKEGAPPQFADEVYFPPMDSPAVQGAFLASGEVLGSVDDKEESSAADASLAALKEALKAQAMKRKAKVGGARCKKRKERGGGGGGPLAPKGETAEVAKDDSNETGGTSAEGEDVLGVLSYLRQVAQDTASLLDENKDGYDVFIPAGCLGLTCMKKKVAARSRSRESGLEVE
ncbi:hypothetical protein HPB48_012247 [Haemaphysalis longicornis]|uniref:Uncharacterized protein n=1 Tax=Haemaphysalis longicornis TaxID=44386 RepID=A0A9J6G8S8_HAELO|nr:hypothetical protein HPB48_012247 [Haemaphysalis longicornis]